MKLADALPIAESIRDTLAPYCERIEIAGSIRRRKPEVGDIEIICVRRNRDLARFVREVERWERIKGKPTGRYTQRRHSSGMKVDIFMVTPESWGLQMAIRTGSARFSHEVLATGWIKKGYHSREGLLYYTGLSTGRLSDEEVLPSPTIIREERELFDLLGIPWVEPEYRF